MGIFREMDAGRESVGEEESSSVVVSSVGSSSCGYGMARTVVAVTQAKRSELKNARMVSVSQCLSR